MWAGYAPSARPALPTTLAPPATRTCSPYRKHTNAPHTPRPAPHNTPVRRPPYSSDNRGIRLEYALCQGGSFAEIGQAGKDSACVVVGQYVAVGAALTGHGVGANLAHAHAVAVADGGQHSLAALPVDGEVG